jgi:transposase
MEKESARNQILERLHERRKQVVRLHKKAIKIMKIVELTGLSYPTVRATIDRFEEGGLGGYTPSPLWSHQGRWSGTQPEFPISPNV